MQLITSRFEIVSAGDGGFVVNEYVGSMGDRYGSSPAFAGSLKKCLKYLERRLGTKVEDLPAKLQPPA